MCCAGDVVDCRVGWVTTASCFPETAQVVVAVAHDRANPDAAIATTEFRAIRDVVVGDRVLALDGTSPVLSTVYYIPHESDRSSPTRFLRVMHEPLARVDLEDRDPRRPVNNREVRLVTRLVQEHSMQSGHVTCMCFGAALPPCVYEASSGGRRDGARDHSRPPHLLRPEALRGQRRQKRWLRRRRRGECSALAPQSARSPSRVRSQGSGVATPPETRARARSERYDLRVCRRATSTTRARSQSRHAHRECRAATRRAHALHGHGQLLRERRTLQQLWRLLSGAPRLAQRLCPVRALRSAPTRVRAGPERADCACAAVDHGHRRAAALAVCSTGDSARLAVGGRETGQVGRRSLSRVSVESSRTQDGIDSSTVEVLLLDDHPVTAC
ncbi:hypothetical protein PybrP1_001018 [[Pythium] brassicae (nom. inval.)]|nr:hypothetical protein PybrP1_001018 [[Pythium] brassicae (nom. inval.)]